MNLKEYIHSYIYEHKIASGSGEGGTSDSLTGKTFILISMC